VWSGRHLALVSVALGVSGCGRIGYGPLQAGISTPGSAGTTGTGVDTQANGTSRIYVDTVAY
jgi:hypothetical protein